MSKNELLGSCHKGKFIFSDGLEKKTSFLIEWLLEVGYLLLDKNLARE